MPGEQAVPDGGTQSRDEDESPSVLGEEDPGSADDVLNLPVPPPLPRPPVPRR